MKKIWMILLALCLTVGTLTACGGGETETPTETETESVGETETPTETETDDEIVPTGTVDFTLTIKDQDGNVLEGVTVVFSDEYGVVLTTASDADGVITGTIVGGTYSVTMDNLPEYTLAEVYSYTFTPTTAEGVLAVRDNTPNGTADRPFFLAEQQTEVILPVGCSYIYRVRGIDRTLKIADAADLEVLYNGETYVPDAEGVISVSPISAARANEFSSFTVISKAADEKTVILELGSVPGTAENPFVIEDISAPVTVTVPKGVEICFTWMPAVNGRLILNSSDPMNDIVMQSGSVVTERSNGASELAITITQGQPVTLRVASLSEEESHTVTFIFHLEIQLPEHEF